MSRRGASWPYIVGVAVLGIGLGTLIAGVPESAERVPYRIPADDTAVTVPVQAIPIDTMPADTGPTEIGTTTEPPTTEPPTTAPPTTSAPETTVAVTTSAPSTTSPVTVEAPVRDRADVRLVVANGDGRFNLVGANVKRLRALGYVTIDETDVNVRPPSTIIYVRPGFEREADVLAQDLQTPDAVITALPTTPVTANDEKGDLVVVLGPDAQR
jgi:hypothetical protein